MRLTRKIIVFVALLNCVLPVLLDAAANNAYTFWVGCTEALCESHNLYVPSPALVNLTTVDELCFASGDDCIQGWRVNDTMTFGTVTTQATWDALFDTTQAQPADGNLGLAKSYWYGSRCPLDSFTGWVEQAFAHGDINVPVMSLYAVRRILVVALSFHLMTKII